MHEIQSCAVDDEEPSLRASWESEANHWIAWARREGHDDYWNYAPRFQRDIVPAPSGLTLEVGCGEGRVTRDLERAGHDVIAVDASPTLLAAAASAEATHGRYAIADAARLPFVDEAFSIVVAYNSLMDMDEMEATIREISRVTRAGGTFCICVTHPMSDAGRFRERQPDAAFVIEGSYLAPRYYDATFERDGLSMRFRYRTHSLEAYARALESAGFLIQRILEPAQLDEVVAGDPAEARWQRLANFMFVRAVKPPKVA